MITLMSWLLMACSASTGPAEEPGGSPPSPEAATAPPPAPARDVLRLAGECDASAVIVDDERLLVATDETTSLVAYPRSGGPAVLVPLAGALEAAGMTLEREDGEPRELDLEGVAALGGRLWWTGSHGLSRKGKERPNRRLLFATSRPRFQEGSAAIEVVGRPRDLRPSLLALPDLGPQLAKAAALPPKRGGLDIEGLAADPGTGSLLLGLRSPLTSDGRAWVVSVADPEALLADPAAAPVLAERARLDLGGRGIRSLEWSEALRGWVVVAGPAGDDGPFAVYLWDGDSAPQPLSLPIGELRPEGLAIDGGSLLLVSDDGGVTRSGRDCKDRRKDDADDPEVYFRAVRVPLPSPG